MHKSKQLVVYGRVNSGNVQKVLWAAHELSLPFQRVDAGRGFPLNKLNPNGLVPVIDDNGFVQIESNSIIRYLAQTYPNPTKDGSQLCPTNAQDKARADQWMDWCFSLEAKVKPVFMGLVRTPKEQQDMRLIKESAVEAAKAWSIVEQQLSQSPFIAGDKFSMGDIPLGMWAHRWLEMRKSYGLEDQPELPGLRAWYNRLLQREGYVLNVAKHMK